MTKNNACVLLVEDNPSYARLVREALEGFGAFGWKLECCARLADGLARLKVGDIDAVLLDLSLPDCCGAQTVRKVYEVAPEVPILVLTGMDNETLSREVIKEGAQDCLVKCSLGCGSLSRALRYSIERKRTGNELQRTRDAALRAARMKSEFLATMSHEIRTPLNAVIGAAQLLLGTELSPEQTELANTLSTGSEALLGLVNDVLDFSKICAGRLEFEQTTFEFFDAVDGVIDLFAEQAQRKGIALATYVDVSVPLALRGDPGRLRRVLMNLVGNALKFTQQGQVTVRVAAERATDSDVTLRFTVRDTGIGITPKARQYLFRPFSQADTAVARKYGGTGLGLAISAALAKRMGGGIGMDSTPGAGSTFWFTARMRKADGASAWKCKRGRVRGMRVLVVGPESAAVRAAAEQMTSWRMRIETASDSTKAVAAVRNSMAAGDPFRAVLFDVEEGVGGGFAVVDEIRAEPALERLAMLAMYPIGRPPDQNLTRQNAIHSVLRKPLRQSQLLDALCDLADEVASAPAAGSASISRTSGAIGVGGDGQEAVSQARVLVAEDDPVNRKIIEMMLRRLGYIPEIVPDGAAAMSALGRATYDMVLMDCRMPVLDGYEATSRIRQRERGRRHTPIIGLTANVLSDDREHCLAAGMDDYIGKPVAMEHLSAVLRRWIAPPGPISPALRPRKGLNGSANPPAGERIEEMKGPTVHVQS